MTNTFNPEINLQLHENGENYKYNMVSLPNNDWSDVTKESLDSFPQVWTRGLLYFLIFFVSITLPWAILFEVDETGTARGQLEPQGKTVKLDASVAGSVIKLNVKEGQSVKSGETLLELEADSVRVESRQVEDKLDGELRELSQLNLLKNQLILAVRTQQQQTQAQNLEKQAQVAQARQSLRDFINSYQLRMQEQAAQVNQASEAVKQADNSFKLSRISLTSAEREVERFQQAFQEQVVAEISLVEKKDVAQERKKLYEQNFSEIKQARLRLVQQQSVYEQTYKQSKADIEQAKLRVKEQERSANSLEKSGNLAILKSYEQLRSIEREITALRSQIAQTRSQIKALNIQLAQRVIKAPIEGTVFQLPIQKAGAVVQPGSRIAEIAPKNSPLIVRAQIATTESGSLRNGLPVKLKLDAFPFQEYGVLEGELINISPTTSEIETANGNVAVYNLDISLNRNCIPTVNRCTPLRPGDTVTAEVIVRQRRIIDFLLDPFKQLQEGGIKL